jgi:hypothetical protein
MATPTETQVCGRYREIARTGEPVIDRAARARAVAVRPDAKSGLPEGISLPSLRLQIPVAALGLGCIATLVRRTPRAALSWTRQPSLGSAAYGDPDLPSISILAEQRSGDGNVHDGRPARRFADRAGVGPVALRSAS